MRERLSAEIRKVAGNGVGDNEIVHIWHMLLHEWADRVEIMENTALESRVTELERRWKELDDRDFPSRT